MKTFIFLALSLSAMLTVCCQSQPAIPVAGGNGPTTVVQPPQEILRNLVQDTVAISSLTDDNRRVLSLRYDNHPAVTSYVIINNPFR